jgi:hypothetical protein
MVNSLAKDGIFISNENLDEINKLFNLEELLISMDNRYNCILNRIEKKETELNQIKKELDLIVVNFRELHLNLNRNPILFINNNKVTIIEFSENNFIYKSYELSK